MTLISRRDKIAQMFILGFEGCDVSKDDEIAKAIRDENLGGVILFDYNFKKKSFDKNIKSPDQVKVLNQTLQDLAKNGNQMHQRPDLPLFISVDYEGGKVNRLHHRYGFPETITAKAFASLSPHEATQVANQMANTLKAHGFNVNFAPVLDVDVNPTNPVMGQLERSFSADNTQVCFYASIIMQALNAKNIVAAYKHFPGHGSSTADSHLGFVDVTASWQEEEILPYYLTKLKSSKAMVMTAHIVNRQLDMTGLPATLSKTILSDILRAQLGFEGVIVTDDMQMKAISAHYPLENALEMAINAGADMLIFGNQLSDKPQSLSHLIDIVEDKVEKGEISSSRIDEAYERISSLKAKL